MTEKPIVPLTAPSDVSRNPETRPRVWTTFAAPLLAIVVAIVLQVAVAAAIAVGMVSRGVAAAEIGTRIIESLTSPPVFLATLVLGQFSFAAVTLLVGRLSPEPMWQRLGYGGSSSQSSSQSSAQSPAKLYLLTMLGSILPLTIAIGCVYLVAMVIPPDETFEKVFEKITPLWGLLFVVLVAVLPGFIEETLFRGYIQTRLLKRWSPAVAIGVTSVLFALVHITPHAMAVALPMGIWLGYIAYRTNSLGPSIACHAFVNGGLNLWRLIAKFGELSEFTQNVCHVIFVLIGSVCFVFAMRMLQAYNRPMTLAESTT